MQNRQWSTSEPLLSSYSPIQKPGSSSPTLLSSPATFSPRAPSKLPKRPNPIQRALRKCALLPVE
jgi:hypothetical protein